MDEIEQHLEEHVAFLEKYYTAGKFVFSGRKVPRTGGVILARHCASGEVSEIIKEDPFYIHQLADYQIIEFMATRYVEAFGTLIDLDEFTIEK